MSQRFFFDKFKCDKMDNSINKRKLNDFEKKEAKIVLKSLFNDLIDREIEDDYFELEETVIVDLMKYFEVENGLIKKNLFINIILTNMSIKIQEKLFKAFKINKMSKL
jgi:hypothetical protein